MGYRLTSEERRIIERSGNDRERSEEIPAKPVPLWRSILAWTGGILFLIAVAMLMTYLGSRV